MCNASDAGSVRREAGLFTFHVFTGKSVRLAGNNMSHFSSLWYDPAGIEPPTSQSAVGRTTN